MTAPATARVRRPSAVAPTPPPVPADPPRAALVLYVSLPAGADEPAPSAAELAEAAEMLRELAQDLLPTAQTATALSLVPGTSGDVRRIGDRISHLRLLPPEADEPGAPAPLPLPDVLAGSGDAG
ncbi:hypothetical protein [Cellulomonas shaoxiangyii]|uniref:Uncharacterized protein n=1 Tax=Cellulomonas shaoxiangyii TaxID=2566013 RepID=A0A4P7SMC5_9CELL|nr:hypothetical protein [Cellulomonas shaoxiangyii]QCB94717.1 hypothetical protein E5225_15300 [Cellulomonas shaoxiangyii]TGY85047.1 hypothetical protein E5226_08225 [Cellulomonas shaoxiangyii]